MGWDGMGWYGEYKGYDCIYDGAKKIEYQVADTCVYMSLSERQK